MTTVVQSVSQAFTAAASVNLTLTSTGAGNKIVVSMWIEGDTTAYTGFTVTDNQSNQSVGSGYQAGTSAVNGNRGALVRAHFSPNAGVTSITCTFTGGSSSAYGTATAQEVSSITAFDQTGSSLGFTASPATATAGGADTTTDNFVVAAFSAGGTGFANAISSPCTGGAAWTAAAVDNNDSSTASGQISYRVNASSVTDAPSWTFATTPLTSGSAAAVWSFKTSAGASMIDDSANEWNALEPQTTPLLVSVW